MEIYLSDTMPLSPRIPVVDGFDVWWVCRKPNCMWFSYDPLKTDMHEEECPGQPEIPF
jgi:hypothetical protein